MYTRAVHLNFCRLNQEAPEWHCKIYEQLQFKLQGLTFRHIFCCDRIFAVFTKSLNSAESSIRCDIFVRVCGNNQEWIKSQNDCWISHTKLRSEPAERLEAR